MNLSTFEKLKFCQKNIHLLSDSEIFNSLGIGYEVILGRCMTNVEVLAQSLNISKDFLLTCIPSGVFNADSTFSILIQCNITRRGIKNKVNSLYNTICEKVNAEN